MNNKKEQPPIQSVTDTNEEQFVFVSSFITIKDKNTGQTLVTKRCN